MADERRIISGSFKGVPIAIDGNSIAGGRKVAIKQFPNRNTQVVEDLGLRPRKYTIDIVINAKNNEDYLAYRDRLLAALESAGAGVLIHPLYGRIENIVAASYSLNERLAAYGDTTVSVVFEPSNNTGIPQSSGNVATQIEAANDAVQSAVASMISNDFSVNNAFAGNFGAAADKINGVIDQASTATSFAGETPSTLNEFSSQLSGMQGDVNSLVSNPANLATSFTDLFSSVNELYESPQSQLGVFSDFFGFGDDDTEIKQDTAARTERKKNNDVMNSAVAASSLGYAYFAATRAEYQTTRQIDDVTAALDSQYKAVQESNADQATKDAITDMRVKTLSVLDGVRVNTPLVISVDTQQTSARLLSFDYYGSDENGTIITDLNQISDSSFIDGSIEVVTE